MFSGAGTPSTSSNGGGSGSPSDRSAATPSSLALFSSPSTSGSNVSGELNGHHIQGDNRTPSSQPATSNRKRKGAHAVGHPDKSGPGLRQISMRVGEIVESKGTTTYNEVADELVAEFSNLNANPSTAMKIISNDKKEIQWRGLPKTRMSYIEELMTRRTELKDRIEMKTAYMKDLEEQYVCRYNLVQRNKQLYGSGDGPSVKLALPFTLAHQVSPGNIEVEMDEDSHNVHLDFNSSKFQLHDEDFVMKAMGLYGSKETDCIEAHVANGGECSSTLSNYCDQSVQSPRPRGVWVANSHPTPGILKWHAQNEHKK